MSMTYDIAALAASSGLSEEDVLFWLPRLPTGLDDAAIAGKLRQIAAIREPEPGALLTSGMSVPARKGVPWSAARRARFEAKRRRQQGLGR